MKQRADEYIVVEVQKYVRETWDEMKIAVNDVGVVCRQEFTWDDVAVVDDLDPGKCQSQVLWCCKGLTPALDWKCSATWEFDSA